MSRSSERRSGPRRFRATIRKLGPNPYVEVPERVSAAFAPWARAGRISVEGRLGRIPFRATLVPAGKGRHRLFVNGGMRSAAGVGVGDTVVFELRATRPEDIRPPDDVARALAADPGARAAFDALPPSHRLELLRYVDDARTPATRARRIAATVDHVLGRSPPPGSAAARRRPLWTCPRCGQRFVNRNQYHACARYDLEDLFRGKPPEIRALYERVRGMVEACGPVTVVPYRDKVSFMVRVRFAGAVPRQRWLDLAFWLPRRVDAPRFHRVETIGPSVHLHLLRVTDEAQLDAEVAGWLAEAYAVGRQEPLGA